MARREGKGKVLAEPAQAAVLDEARALFDAFDWLRCVDLLTATDAEQPLGGEGLMLLGRTAYLVGLDELAVSAFARAYQRSLETGDLREAARAALGSAFVLENAREPVRSRAWAARAQSLVEAHALGGGEAAWVLAHRAHVLAAGQHLDEAVAVAREGERLGLAARDADSVVLSRLTIGFAELLRGDREAGIHVFDEILLAVSSDETSPEIVGLCYCLSIAACMLVRDVARARSWTSALDRWCAARPDLVAYRGTCLVHRAQMSTLGGNWAGALREVASAEQMLSGTGAGLAAYQLGELHRLMGHDSDAEDAYRRANALGFQPEPGLSRLRTGQGRAEAAVRTLSRLCGEPRPPEDRAELLAARAEAQLSLGEVERARESAAALRAISDALGSPLLEGLADQAEGAVLLATGRASAALDPLRRAQEGWAGLDMPHPCAQTRVLIGRCLLVLGDQDAADLEFEAARECFLRLAAASDLALVDALNASGRRARASQPAGLTDREVEVVRLVAAGHTNRVIAGRLCLSEKTVARHLANVYAKLDIPSRAAATAYAYDHGLV